MAELLGCCLKLTEIGKMDLNGSQSVRSKMFFLNLCITTLLAQEISYQMGWVFFLP